jgi:hypothetical protein
VVTCRKREERRREREKKRGGEADGAADSHLISYTSFAIFF